MKGTYQLKIENETIDLQNNMRFSAFLEASDHLREKNLTTGDLYCNGVYESTVKITYPESKRKIKAS